MELYLDKNLKMSSVVRMTEERIKQFTMTDLEKIIQSFTELEGKIMVNAIKEHRFDKVAHVVEMATYREMQKEVVEGLRLST